MLVRRKFFMKYSKYIVFLVLVSPTLVFAKYDLVGLSGEVRAIVTNRFTDLETFPYELLCDDKVFNEARAVSSFNSLVSRGLGYYAAVEMGNRSFLAQGFKQTGSQLLINDSFFEFEEYDGALNALSAHTLGMGSPVLDHIVREGYQKSLIGFAEEVITCGEVEWYIERYSSASFYDYLVFVKDDSSFCRKSLRFSFRMFKDKDELERGMVDSYIKEQLDVDPEITDDELDSRVSAYRGSMEFHDRLNKHIRLIESASAMIIVSQYEEGICHTPEAFAEKIEALLKDSKSIHQH